jgi:phosphatidylglycerophosphate synthase
MASASPVDTAVELCLLKTLTSAYTFGIEARYPIVALIVLGALSEIADGILARALSVATVTMRRLDSQTDMIFGLSVLWTAWILRPQAVLSVLPLIGLLVVLEIGCYAVSFARFGRETSTHSYLSKLSRAVSCRSVFGADRHRRHRHRLCHHGRHRDRVPD